MAEYDDPTPTSSGNRAVDRYGTLSSLASFANALGRTSAGTKYTNRANNHATALIEDGDAETDVSNANRMDFSTGFIDATQANQYISRLSRDAGRQAQARGGDFDRARNRSRIQLLNSISDVNKTRQYAENEERFKEEYDPVYEQGSDRLNELAGTSMVSASQEAALRARLAGQFRTSAASTINRVAGSLNMRGMGDSPAGAALAASIAQDSDQAMISELRDAGLQVSSINREQSRRDIAAASGLANLRQSAEQAYLSDDRNAAAEIGRQQAALIDTLYNRDQQWDLLEKQIEEAGKQTLADRLGIYGNVLSAYPSFMGMSSPGNTYAPSASQSSQPMGGGYSGAASQSGPGGVGGGANLGTTIY